MIIENEKRRPPFVTLFSEPGQGKTTLACMFPSAILIRVEDGVESVPDAFRPKLMPVCETTQQVIDQIQYVWKHRKDHGCKTVILDSVTRMETMIEKEIVENDPNRPLSINQACGGFGAGVKAVGAQHARIRKALGHLNQHGDMAVIIIAHSEVETIEPPDGDNYMRHQLRLGKKSLAPWVDDVDMVGFIQQQRLVRGAKAETKNSQGKAGKAISDGTREFIGYPTPANVSKNRFGLPDGEPIELPNPRSNPAPVNPLFKYIPYYVENGYCDSAKDVTEESEKVVDHAEQVAQDDALPANEASSDVSFDDDEPQL